MFSRCGLGPEDLDIVGGKSGVAQALGHGFGGGRGAADGVGGVDFDELPENAAREGLRRIVELRGQRGGQSKEDRECERGFDSHLRAIG